MTMWLHLIPPTSQFPLREALNTVGCSNQDIDKARIYIRKEYLNKIASVTFFGQNRAFVYGNDSRKAWIDLPDLAIPAQPLGTAMDLQVRHGHGWWAGACGPQVLADHDQIGHFPFINDVCAMCR